MAVNSGLEKRTVKITFTGETKGKNMMTRRFNKINDSASDDQLMQLAKGISQLTPNQNNDVSVEKTDVTAIND